MAHYVSVDPPNTQFRPHDVTLNLKVEEQTALSHFIVSVFPLFFLCSLSALQFYTENKNAFIFSRCV